MVESRRAIVVAILIGLQTLTSGAQGSVAWLVGRWSEQIPGKSAATDRTPRELLIELENGVLRVTEIALDGDDVRCRLDGAETRSTQVKTKATVEHILKCRASNQSLEIRGRSIASGMTGVPPQQFEIEKKYEMAKDGSLRVRIRVRGLVQGLDTIALADERADFVRSQ